jgi:hypothetical protein
VQAPEAVVNRPPDRHAAGRDVPGRSGGMIGMMLEPSGWPPVRSCRPRMARALCRARLRRRRRDPPLLHRRDPRVRGRRPPVVGSAPVGHDGTAAWLTPSAMPAACRPKGRGGARTRSCRRSSGALAAAPINGHDHAVGLRRLRAAGRAAADRERRGCALRRHRLPQDAVVRAGSRMAGGAWREGEVPRLAGRRLRRDGGVRSPTSPSAPRRWCRRPRSWGSRRSTSPT